METSTQPTSQPGDFNAVRKSIIDLLKQPEYDDGSAGPVLVRLAWCVYTPHNTYPTPLKGSYYSVPQLTI